MNHVNPETALIVMVALGGIVMVRGMYLLVVLMVVVVGTVNAFLVEQRTLMEATVVSAEAWINVIMVLGMIILIVLMVLVKVQLSVESVIVLVIQMLVRMEWLRIVVVEKKDLLIVLMVHVETVLLVLNVIVVVVVVAERFV